MTKAVGYVVALVVLLLGLFIPSLFFHGGSVEAATNVADSGSSDPTTIDSYGADFTLDEDGDLAVVETLKVDFPIGVDRHGIFRFWDRVDLSAPHARRIVHDVQVTFDGGDVEVDRSRKQGGRFDVARIGDPDILVDPGVHTYVIRYRIDGVIEPGQGVDGTSQFYWQLIPAGWAQDIEESHVAVHLPSDSGGVQCTVGVGQGDPCTVKGEGSPDLTVGTGRIPHNTPVTIKTGLALETPPAGTELPWTGRFDPVLGQNELLLGGVGLLGLGAAIGGALLSRRAFERNPRFPVMYAPPDGLGPAQGAFILNESTDRTAYVATLMHAAQHGAVDLSKSDDAWTITDKGGADAWAGLDPVSVNVAHLLGGPGTSFTASKKDVTAGKRLKSEIDSFDSEVKAWATTSGNLVPIRFGSILGTVVLVALGAAVATVIWNPVNMTMVGVIPGAFGVLGLPLLKTGSGTKRTAAGREVWSRTGGFRRILSTPSAKERFDFSGREELYTAYLPWAVAFGCADQWAGKFRTEMGYDPPVPSYFGGYYAGSLIGSQVDSIVADFDSTVDSAISSYDATQSSSSGGGGGFSGGGGGGGGGGGSW